MATIMFWLLEALKVLVEVAAAIFLIWLYVRLQKGKNPPKVERLESQALGREFCLETLWHGGKWYYAIPVDKFFISRVSPKQSEKITGEVDEYDVLYKTGHA